MPSAPSALARRPGQLRTRLPSRSVARSAVRMIMVGVTRMDVRMAVRPALPVVRRMWMNMLADVVLGMTETGSTHTGAVVIRERSIAEDAVGHLVIGQRCGRRGGPGRAVLSQLRAERSTRREQPAVLISRSRAACWRPAGSGHPPGLSDSLLSEQQRSLRADHLASALISN